MCRITKYIGIGLLLGIGLLFSSCRLRAQISEADSLKSLLLTYNDTSRIAPLTRLAWLYRKNDINAAVRYGREAMELATNFRLPQRFIEPANYIGIIFRNIKDYDRGLDVFKKIESLGISAQTPREFAYCKLNIGEMLVYKKKFGEALSYMSESQQMFTEQNDTIGMAYAALRLGDLYKELDNYTQANINYQRCLFLRSHHSIKDTANITTAYVYLARFYKTMGQLKPATLMIDSAIYLAETNRSTYEKNNAYQEKAEILFALGKAKDAISLAQQALARAKKLSNEPDEESAVELLRNIYASLKQYDSAYKYSNYYSRLIITITHRKIQFETEATHLENEWEHKASADKLALSSQRQEVLTRSIIVIIAVFVALSFFYLVRNARKQAKTIRAMEQQRNEIETLRIAEQQVLWLKEGQSSAARIIQESTSLHELSLNISSFIAKYLDSSVVCLYTRCDIAHNNQNHFVASSTHPYDQVAHKDLFEFIGGFAVSHQHPLVRFRTGEGICGQSVRNGTIVIMSLGESTPDNAENSTSSLSGSPTFVVSAAGRTAPHYMMAIPCLYKKEVLAVIECACLHSINHQQQTLASIIGESIALALLTYRHNHILDSSQLSMRQSEQSDHATHSLQHADSTITASLTSGAML